jgi:hypothetical protein
LWPSQDGNATPFSISGDIMGNSSIQVRALVDDAKTFAEIAPVLPTGGFSDLPALSIVNDTMTAMLMGTPDGEPFNWKWNRILPPPFFINSFQQDYFIAGLVNLGWLESCTAAYQNISQFPKNIAPIEVRRDLLETSSQMGTSNYAKICWMQNDTMQFGLWGQSQALSQTGCPNPGPGKVYTNPAGLSVCPSNPITCITDAFKNLWVLTTYGTCGNTNPFTTNQNPNNLYPTFDKPNIVAVTVTDGSVVWTAINPKGQGFRINPPPTETGPLWLIIPVAQQRIPQFKTMAQFLDPVPDDYYTYFKQGFFAQCFRRSPDQKVRARFKDEWSIWLKSLDNAVKQGSREMDDWGFYPGNPGVMDTGWGFGSSRPDLPYGPWVR